MACIMPTLAVTFSLGETNPVRTPMIVSFILLLWAVYSSTAGTSSFALSAEVFPAITKEAEMALAMSVNMTALGILLLVFPRLNEAIGGYTVPLGLLGVLNAVLFCCCFLFGLDTNNCLFGRAPVHVRLPTPLHIKYRMTYVLPEL
ncbi:hypothetical protein K469DRAFT_584416 [Zopfia rhizophila CBS 207.26]|uniref:Major facilitator superfamily (MFS) profile domain-containing protein n=1 Tax=Zopfia rhizophila CBS 207.26 TaxID=1314779 RepID=A0A6A6DXW9_9PEZI|nr:hypothetical protein K469DRAFT_584416 [Zopfia rhizophila CBS 207.26]